MDDLASLKSSAEFLRTVKAATGQDDAQCSLASVRINRAIARITALEASLAEAEGRVIAEVVAWLEAQALRQDTVSLCLGLTEAATALENGEWKK